MGLSPVGISISLVAYTSLEGALDEDGHGGVTFALLLEVIGNELAVWERRLLVIPVPATSGVEGFPNTRSGVLDMVYCVS